MDFGFSIIPSDPFREKALEDVLSTNNKTAEHGLALTREEAAKLIEIRNTELTNAGRIEFGGGALRDIIEAFCDSPYINRDSYADTIGELLEIFYYYKNETYDLLSDAQLIAYMKSCFNGVCQGSTELLKGRELHEMARRIRSGDLKIPENDPRKDFINEVDYDEQE